MKLATPNSDMSLIRVQMLLENGSCVTMVAGGGPTVEVDDNSVEVLLDSCNPQGQSVKSAWVRGLGSLSIEAYTERKAREAELASLREERKERVREKNQAAKNPKPESKD